MNLLDGLTKRVGRLVSGDDLPPTVAAGSVLVLLFSLAGLVLSASTNEVTGNPASRLGTMESLIDHDEWLLDSSIYRYVTVDKVRIGGEFLSSKPPVYAAIGSAAYAGIRMVTGSTMAEAEMATITWLRIVLHVIPFLIGLVLAGRFLRRRTEHDAVWFWGFAAFATGTFIYAYSATINNHALAALLVMAGLAAAVETKSGEDRPWLWLGAGFTASLAVTMDFGAGVFAISVTALLALNGSKQGLLWFFAGAVGPLVAHFHLTDRLTGSPLPFYGQGELYDYPGSYWNAARDFDALDEPFWTYAFHALIGHHGLLTMTPLFVLAIPGTVLMIRRPTERSIGILTAVVVTATVVIYTVFGPGNYGGTASGMRWFIILAPLLWYAAMRYADARWSLRWFRWLLGTLILLGVAHASAALADPWSVSPWNWLLRVIGLGSVPEFDWFQ